MNKCSLQMLTPFGEIYIFDFRSSSDKVTKLAFVTRKLLYGQFCTNPGNDLLSHTTLSAKAGYFSILAIIGHVSIL